MRRLRKDSSRLLGSFQLLSNVTTYEANEIPSASSLTMSSETVKRTPQLHTKRALKLSQDLRIRDCLAGLIVLQHRLLLVDLGRDVFLRELELHTGGLHGFADRGRDLGRRRHVVVTIKLRDFLVVRAYRADRLATCRLQES